MVSRQTGFALVLAVSLVLSGTVGLAGIASGQTGGTAQGEPDLDVHLPQHTVLPGETTELSLVISNDGEMDFGSADYRDAVTAARNVRVSAEAEGPLRVETGKQPIGTVTTNRPGNAAVALTIPEGTEPGTYDIDVELEYSYTSTIWIGSTRIDDDTKTITRTVEVTVDDAPRFDIQNVSTDTRVGDRGTLSVTLANDGSQPADDVRLSLESQSAKFLFGESQAGTTRAGTIEPGENATLTYDVAVQSSASVREFALVGTVAYTDADGVPGVQERLSAGISPLPEQTFSVDPGESTLRVGEEGELRGTVTNTGPVIARNVVVQFAEQSPTAIPVESSVTVGTLEPGASADFAIPVEMTTEGKAVSKTFDLAITFRNEEGEKRAYQDASVSTAIEPRRDQFDITVDNRTIAAGTDRSLEVTVTNELDETVRDVDLRMFVDDPLDSSDDEAYVESLDPGESVSVVVTMNAAGDAVAKTYPASFDVRYDDTDGTSHVSETVTVPMTVTESEGGGLPLGLIGVLVAALVLVALAYWYRGD